jgi:hypothetical protein
LNATQSASNAANRQVDTGGERSDADRQEQIAIGDGISTKNAVVENWHQNRVRRADRADHGDEQE